MKNLLLYTALFSMMLFIGCSNDSEEPAIDCSQSDLSVSISNTTEPSCSSSGSITVSGSGGTAPYEYSLDGSNFQSSDQFQDLVAGSITVTVRDSDGCEAELMTTLNAGDGIALEINTQESDCLEPT
ncbi:SprB repeat-containing protein [Ekhidna sp.]|uniref:SprB repeat-containing protein n=1 Tax=Ekhidna sp. TaxID=2608089 RepID=UPI003CCBABB0